MSDTHLAWPCLPVLEVLMSTTLQGKPLINKYLCAAPVVCVVGVVGVVDVMGVGREG